MISFQAFRYTRFSRVNTMSDTIKNFSDQNTNAKLISSFTSNDHQQQNTHSHLQSQKKQHRIYEYYEEQKINHTSKVLNNNESFLNCLQFINLIQYYFNDSPTIRLSDQHTSETSAYSSASEFGIMPFRSADDCAGAQSRSSPADLSCIQTCYPCIVCSSQFSFEQTFHLHLERRSILIRFLISSCCLWSNTLGVLHCFTFGAVARELQNIFRETLDGPILADQGNKYVNVIGIMDFLVFLNTKASQYPNCGKNLVA